MNNTKKAPCAVSAEGRTNAINYTPNSADTNPAHPANLCPAVAEHLLLAAFGEAFGGLSARTVRTAQELALTIVIQAAGCTRDPLMTEEFGVGMCLLDFAHHARRYHYDAAGIVRLADEVDPSSPFGPWADVAREMGVANE